MKKIYSGSKNMCLPFFHRWGASVVSDGVGGRRCDYIRYCQNCGAHQVWPTGFAKPWGFPEGVSNEFKDNYMKAMGGNVNIK